MKFFAVALILLFCAPALAEKPTYAWLGEMPASSADKPATIPLQQRFEPPSGFKRIDLEADSFGAWLRGLPTRTDRTHVLAFDGRKLDSPSAAVVLMDVGTKDLQQCADTAIRLHAEWLWSRGQADRLTRHFTSGDAVDWKSWRKGKRWWLKGNDVESGYTASADTSYTNFRTFLDVVFTYAGTRSLHRDAKRVQTPMPGDFYLQGGSPGHAVVILDVAVDGTGRRAALIGQGFMPAQELHVLKSGDARVLDGVWFLLPDEDHPSLKTPSWKAFAADEAWRFK